MSELTGVNADVNEEIQPITDVPVEDDGEFETWLESLNERTANGGADAVPPTSPRQLFFRTLKANGWSHNPKQPDLRPLWQTLHHAWATIRCARLRSLPTHRRVFCLLFFLPGRYYLCAAIVGLAVFSSHVAASAPQQTFNDTPGRCSTLNGKKICDGHEWQSKQAKIKHTKVHKLKANEIILPARICDQNETQESACYYAPIDPDRP